MATTASGSVTSDCFTPAADSAQPQKEASPQHIIDNGILIIRLGVSGAFVCLLLSSFFSARLFFRLLFVNCACCCLFSLAH